MNKIRHVAKRICLRIQIQCVVTTMCSLSLALHIGCTQHFAYKSTDSKNNDKASLLMPDVEMEIITDNVEIVTDNSSSKSLSDFQEYQGKSIIVRGLAGNDKMGMIILSKSGGLLAHIDNSSAWPEAMLGSEVSMYGVMRVYDCGIPVIEEGYFPDVVPAGIYKVLYNAKIVPNSR